MGETLKNQFLCHNSCSSNIGFEEKPKESVGETFTFAGFCKQIFGKVFRKTDFRRPWLAALT